MEVAPAPVLGLGTFGRCGRGGGTAVVAHECPREQTGDGVPDSPPDGHEGDEPCVFDGQKFQEVGCVEDVVSACACGVDGDPLEWLADLSNVQGV